MNHLITLATYLKDEGVLTYGTKTSEAFIEKLPTKFNGSLSILFSEMKQSNQQLGFANKYAGYENRSADIYIRSQNLNKAKQKSLEIYNKLREKHSLDSIFAIELASPVFVGQEDNNMFIYVIDLNFKLR